MLITSTFQIHLHNVTFLYYPRVFVSMQKMHIRASKAERQETLHNEKMLIVDADPVKANNLVSARMKKFIGSYSLYRETKLPKNVEIIKGRHTDTPLL